MVKLLFFILGLVVGGLIAFFTVCLLSSRRISQYELMNEKQRQKIKRLRDSLPSVLEESRENILGVDLCVCCGEPIPEGQMVCSQCLKNNS